MKNFVLSLFALAAVALVTVVKADRMECAMECTNQFIDCSQTDAEGALSEICVDNLKECKVQCLADEKPEIYQDNIERYLYGDEPKDGAKRLTIFKGLKCWSCKKAAGAI